ncbi:MAG TPA: hypothetical protein ENK78_08910, partial [Thiothrix sp.]|nr:hypothetical protein [Thiothrix sp.]
MSLVGLLTGCQQEHPSEPSNHSITQTTYATPSADQPVLAQQQLWLDIIQARSQGYLASDANIRVLFAHNIVDEAAIGQNADVLLSVKQQDQWVKGKALFESQQEIVFIPEQPLLSGGKYTVVLSYQALQNQFKQFQATLKIPDNQPQAQITNEPHVNDKFINIAALNQFKQGIAALSNDFQFTVRTIPLDFDLITDSLQDDLANKHQMRLTGQLFTSDKVDPSALK